MSRLVLPYHQTIRKENKIYFQVFEKLSVTAAGS